MSEAKPMGETERRAEWEAIYTDNEPEALPWYSEYLDHDLAEALSSRGIRAGAILDIGTGTGTQAAALASLGFDVVGTDISDAAIRKAKLLSARPEFIVDDILATNLKARRFDHALDRGCFHTLEPEDRGVYLASVLRVLRKDGLLFLKCFSSEETRVSGPHRFSPAELEEIFEQGFEVLDIKGAEFEGSLVPRPRALFAVLRKR